MAEERVVDFQRSILQNRVQRKPVRQQEQDKHAVARRMTIGATTRVKQDWRLSSHHEQLLQRFRPSPQEKLDPLSQISDQRFRETPKTESKTHFNAPTPEVAQKLYQERRADCKRGTSVSLSSQRVQVHLDSPFYKAYAEPASSTSTSAARSSGFSSRVEMLQARKAADHQRAIETFGSPSSMGFADFSCGRKSMDAVVRNINSIADDRR